MTRNCAKAARIGWSPMALARSPERLRPSATRVTGATTSVRPMSSALPWTSGLGSRDPIATYSWREWLPKPKVAGSRPVVLSVPRKSDTVVAGPWTGSQEGPNGSGNVRSCGYADGGPPTRRSRTRCSRSRWSMQGRVAPAARPPATLPRRSIPGVLRVRDAVAPGRQRSASSEARWAPRRKGCWGHCVVRP